MQKDEWRERKREREGEREREKGEGGERENVCDVVMCCFFVPNNIVATHNRSGFVLGLSVSVSMVKYHPYTTPGDCLDKCHVCR